MHQIIETIKSQGVPIGSTIRAAQHLGLSGIGQLASSEYVRRLKELTGKEVSYDTDEMYRMAYSYFVVESLREWERTDILDAEDIFKRAETKAAKLVTENNWMFARSEGEEKMDAEGNPKPKKGAKKEMAKKVYEEQIKDKITKRKEAIEILVAEVGLTKAGASTYYANLKKGTL